MTKIKLTRIIQLPKKDETMTLEVEGQSAFVALQPITPMDIGEEGE